MKTNLKNQKGITLVALIITIIILVILAAVSIRAAYNSGIIDYSVNGTQEYVEGSTRESTSLSGAEALMQSVVNKLDEIAEGSSNNNNNNNNTAKTISIGG